MKHLCRSLWLKYTLPISIFVLGTIVSAIAQNSTTYALEFSSQTGKHLALNVDEIVDVQVRVDQEFEQVLVVLTDAARVLFGEFSTENVGQRITVRVCGDEIWQGGLLTPMWGGRLPLFGYDADEAQRIGDILMGSRECW